jgi:para-nitrobenzyl esterase
MGATVETRQGRVSGREEAGVQVYLGLPFARPPVGERRFRAPEPPERWSGVRPAQAFGRSAPQRPLAVPLPGLDVGAQDEDCLYLNVYTPAADAGRRPVLVWIHGGAFVIGSGSQPIYDGRPLARRGGAVVVTVNYRLGPLGFFYAKDACPGLSGAVGNAGLRDQVAALEWVRDNIERFGGDPDDVTIFGESAGGMSVGTLLGVPAARGLFARAIPQSGAAANVHTQEAATQVAEQFLEELGVPAAGAARSLRELPPGKLLELHDQTVLKLGTSLGVLPFQPVVDGDFLPQPPLEAVRAGAAAEVSLLIGTTRDEWKLFGFLDPSIGSLDEAGLRARLATYGSDPETLLAAYRARRPGASPADLWFAIQSDRIFRIPAIQLAEAQCAHQPATFMYRFDWATPALGGSLGACHAVELPFVFGLADAPAGQLFAGGGPEAVRLQDRVMDAWLAFARSGDPSHPGLPGGRWPAYDSERRTTLLFDRECALEQDPHATERRAW